MLQTLWCISKAVHQHSKTALQGQHKRRLTKLLKDNVKGRFLGYRSRKNALPRQHSKSTQPETSSLPQQPHLPQPSLLTLLEQTPHHHLWNLPTATPQACLPSILWLTALLSALIQYVWPRILPSTYRSSTWSPVSSGLRRLIALHDKAITTAWDLVTQTHLSCRVS